MTDQGVLDILQRETRGKRYRSHRYCHDVQNHSAIEYDNDREVQWKNFGEKSKPKKPIDLTQKAKRLIECKNPPLFSYFLDGSRHTYKVDDLMYEKQVYPIIAGQIGVCCCKRTNKKMKSSYLGRENVIAIPRVACKSDWGAELEIKALLHKINDNRKKIRGNEIYFNKILLYSTSKDNDTYEKKGIAKIQDRMVNLEQSIVAELAKSNYLNQNNYLIKDGSLEYKPPKKNEGLYLPTVRNYYKYVVGVSKSFNPTKCLDKSGDSNSDIIAGLRLFERTPSYMYQSSIAGDAFFLIWYVRIREPQHTNNVFDGILKVEKIIVSKEETDNGVDSDLIDNISAHIINERNPVCYGNDQRWANHLYPIYLTERYIKSQYISNSLYMQLF